MVQAQAKVQEGTVRWRSSVNSWELCGRPGTGQQMSQGCMQAMGRAVPFSKTENQAENCDSRVCM